MRLEIAALPDDPVAASAAFHRDWLERAEEALGQGDLLLVFAPADHTHRGWRAAVVAALARKHVPARVNAAASNDAAAIAAAERYFAAAPGVTGQYFALDSIGAGNVA